MAGEPEGMETGSRRGRPRSAEARRRILEAARALLDEGGLPAVTMEAIAQRAQVGKPTIYRAWPNAQAVAMTALMERPAAPTPADPAPRKSAPRRARSSSAAIGALREQLQSVVAAFATRAGRSAAALIASADAETEIAKAFRHNVVLKGRTAGRALLERAIAEGAVRADIDIEAALDLLFGPIFFRLLLGHQPLDAAFAHALVDHALAGLAEPGSGAVK
jgi:AcrR family transcriptional regulator